MKKIIFLLVVIQSAFMFGQEPPKMPKYNAKNAANIFYYNISEIPDELKIKKDAVQQKTLSALREYNDRVKEIEFLNTFKLQKLELAVNSISVQDQSNPDVRNDIIKQIETVIVPIRDSISAKEKNLNETLAEVLSKKQQKRWIKYQRREKKKLIPEMPSNNNPPPQQNMGRRGNGMNRRF